MEESRIRRVIEIVLIAAFLVFVLLPFAGKLLPAEGAFALTENRRPAPFPTIELGRPGWGWSIVSFPRRFERYWNDSFAFRWYLIRAHSLAKLWLGVSPSPKALVGRDGFLFYAAEQSVDYFRGVKPFTAPDLVRWRDDLENRRQWLAERGIRYLVVVAPNKETIYGEFMPPELHKVRADSRLDQLLEYLRTNSSIEVADVRGALIAAKASQRVYHKTDTHWNDAGAMIAAGAILARLKAWYPGIDVAPFPGQLRAHMAPGGDLARILALEDRFPEKRFDWVPSSAPCRTEGGRYPRENLGVQCVPWPQRGDESRLVRGKPRPLPGRALPPYGPGRGYAARSGDHRAGASRRRDPGVCRAGADVPRPARLLTSAMRRRDSRAVIQCRAVPRTPGTPMLP